MIVLNPIIWSRFILNEPHRFNVFSYQLISTLYILDDVVQKQFNQKISECKVEKHAIK